MAGAQLTGRALALAAVARLALALAPLACAGAHESAAARDLAKARERYGQRAPQVRRSRRTARSAEAVAEPASPPSARSKDAAAADVPPEPAPPPKRAAPPLGRAGLARYVSLALKQSPALRASFERWQASVLRISRARRLPEPTLGFGYFVRSVETRVGPQQARVSLQQAFPWPAKLTAGADAASARARAMQRRFEARALAVERQVATAYWDLWQLRTTRAIHHDHVQVLRSLSESVRARLSTGTAMLADVQQLDLAAARIGDDIRGMQEAERGSEARLRAAIGAGAELPVPTPEPPGHAALPEEPTEQLASWVRAHPEIESLGQLSRASQAAARAESADRLPSFSIGADWILTGEAAAAGVAESGKDAVILGASVRLPLWQGSYDDAVAAAEADARAQRAEQQALIDQAEAELVATLAQLADAARRVRLYRETLVPQAQSTYESVLGAFAVGRAAVAQALLAQRDLLELRIDLERARAEHARTWARLEELTGRELTGRELDEEPPGSSGGAP